MFKIATCKRRDILCTDCGEASCAHAGDKGADCPKYNCDNPVPNDCNHCKYIDNYIRIMRGRLRSKA